MAEVLNFCLLFILPFLILPFGVSPFETPKILVAEILIGLICLITFFTNKKIAYLPNPKLLVFVVGILILITIHLISAYSMQQIFGNSLRMQGSFLLFLLLLLAVISPKMQFQKVDSKIFLSLLGIEFLSALFISSGNVRAVGTLGEPNSLAAFIVFLWPFCLFSLKKKTFLKELLLFGVSLSLIIISGSRSGLVAFSIQIVCMSLLKLKISTKKILLVSLCLIILSLTLPFFDQSSSFENRSTIWETGFWAGLEKPILGWGFGNTDLALHETSLKLNNNIRGEFVDSAHNLLLDWWVQGGLVGFLLITSLLFEAFKNFLKNSNELGLVLLLGLLTTTLFNPVSVVILAEFWWLIGQSFRKVK